MTVSLENVSKSYGDLTVLDNLTIEIEKGKIVGLLGPNGVGKTTLLEIVTGQLSQDTGTVEVLDHSLPSQEEASYSLAKSFKESLNALVLRKNLEITNNKRIELKKDIGALPENEFPSSFLSAREYLTTFGKLRGMSQEEIDGAIDEWSSRLKYEEVLDTLSSDLSQGQKQKVMITQAFMHKPEIVFIDEPLANLDPTIRSIVMDYLESYVEDGEHTVVLSTHHIDDALKICSEIHLLHTGTDYEKIDNTDQVTNEEITDRIKNYD